MGLLTFEPVTQAKVAEWQKSQFGELSVKDRFEKLCEEMAELIDAFEAWNDNPQTQTANAFQELTNELADVQICLFGFAATANVQLDAVTRQKFDVVRNRVWVKDEDGNWHRERLTAKERQFVQKGQ